MKNQEQYAAIAMQCSSIAALQKGIDEVLVEFNAATKQRDSHAQKAQELDKRIKAMQQQLREHVRDLRHAWKDDDEPPASV